MTEVAEVLRAARQVAAEGGCIIVHHPPWIGRCSGTCGGATIVQSARDDYALRQRYKQRRRALWRMVRDLARRQAKWGLDPMPERYHLKAVLLMEQAIDWATECADQQQG